MQFIKKGWGRIFAATTRADIDPVQFILLARRRPDLVHHAESRALERADEARNRGGRTMTVLDFREPATCMLITAPWSSGRISGFRPEGAGSIPAGVISAA